METSELALGIDIGAHKASLVLFDGKKRIADRYNPYPPGLQNDFPLYAEWLRSDVNDFIYGKNVKKAGISSAGVIYDGVVKRSPHLGILDGMKLSDIFGSLIAISAIENDAKAFLAYELECGYAKDTKNVLALTLGTGIGGAFSENGEIVRGVHNAAGEVGHMVIGGRSTMEDLASTRFLQKESGSSPKELQERAVGGDEKALSVYEYFGSNLGKGISNLINILDPELIILGGGLSNAYPFFIEPLKRELQLHVLLPESISTPIKISQEPRYASALGAALLALKSK